MSDRKYKFSWDLIGNTSLGRPHMGPKAYIEVYRLMQGTFRDVLEQRFGTEQTDEIFYESGKLAGQHFCKNVLGSISDYNQLFSSIQETYESLGIGIMRVEHSDPEKGSFIFTVEEDLNCSGLPELHYDICVYDEGFMAGLLENFSGKEFQVKEVDCWCTGGRTCRFEANVKN